MTCGCENLTCDKCIYWRYALVSEYCIHPLEDSMEKHFKGDLPHITKEKRCLMMYYYFKDQEREKCRAMVRRYPYIPDPFYEYGTTGLMRI